MAQISAAVASSLFPSFPVLFWAEIPHLLFFRDASQDQGWRKGRASRPIRRRRDWSTPRFLFSHLTIEDFHYLVSGSSHPLIGLIGSRSAEECGVSRLQLGSRP
ncbi:hypothetical protein IE53DRAFT_386258 [Violaceomyces palustris]|uniref:Uncharacterized protein n=1 Tax=Violaceomyces palustris TaxID=1673888 RepID=A0ACD0P005_9BASI|nr:hypothetical protein IE53DRAFT_386258 [Violaceomyces palustris]